MATFGVKVGHGMASVGKPGDIDTVQRNPVGLEIVDSLGNVYVYLVGVAAAAEGVWVSFNAATYQSVILTANGVGRVAIATAAILAANWGWFMVKGFYSTASSDTVAAAGGLFIDATPGRVDDDSVAGDFVNGAVSLGADATNVLSVQICYPYITNTVPA